MNTELILSIPDTRPYPDTPNKNELLRYAADILANKNAAQSKLASGQLLAEIVQELQQRHTLSLSVAMAMGQNPAQYRLLWQYLCKALSPQNNDEIQWLAFPIAAVIGANHSGCLNNSVPVADIQRLIVEYNQLDIIKNAHFLPKLIGSLQLSEIAAEDWFDAKRSLAHAEDFANKINAQPVCYDQGQQVVMLYALCYGAFELADMAGKPLGKAALPLMQVWQELFNNQDITVFANPMAADLPIAALQQGNAQRRRMALDIFTANAVRSIRLQFPRVGVVIASEIGGALLFIFHPIEPNPLPPLVFRHFLTPEEEIPLIVADFLDLMTQCKVEHIHILSEALPKGEVPTYAQAIEMKGGNPFFS